MAAFKPVHKCPYCEKDFNFIQSVFVGFFKKHQVCHFCKKTILINPKYRNIKTVLFISMGNCICWGYASFSGNTLTIKIEEHSNILPEYLKSICFEQLEM